MAEEDRLQQLMRDYDSVFRVMERQMVRVIEVRMLEDKLLLRAEAPSDGALNKVWDEIKAVNPNYFDLIPEITIMRGHSRAEQAGAPHGDLYIVQPGDTLHGIAEQFYGDPHQFMLIYEANSDELPDPDTIRPGQQLVIPLQSDRSS